MRINRKNQVFDPMVKPTSEETYTYLKGFRPPRHAYVLFEKQEYKVVGNGDHDVGTGLFTLNVEHRPEQVGKINQYIGKGFKVLHFDNFPGVHRKDSGSMALAKLYCQGDTKKNPWEELESVLKTCIANNPHWKSEMAEKDEKLAIMERQLAEVTAKLKKQDKASGKDKAEGAQE